MRNPFSAEKLAADIREIYRSGAANPAGLIESYLEEVTQGWSPEDRQALGHDLIQAFPVGLKESAPGFAQSDMASRSLEMLVTLLFGKRLGDIDLPPEELVNRLASSLNIVFDSLNELIGAITSTFMGKSENETIRMVIGSEMEEKARDSSLQSYLDQIKEALAIMNEGYRKAAYIKMKEMLDELDPKRLSNELGSGVKLGPFRKAELFSLFTPRHQTLRNWLDSGLLIEALLQEFEKTCQKLYLQKKGIK